MAPRDDAGAVRIAVGINQGRPDLFRTGKHRLEDELEWEATGCVELVYDGFGIGRHLAEGIFAVEMLTTGEEPDFGMRNVFHEGFLNLARGGLFAQLEKIFHDA